MTNPSTPPTDEEIVELRARIAVALELHDTTTVAGGVLMDSSNALLRLLTQRRELEARAVDAEASLWRVMPNAHTVEILGGPKADPFEGPGETYRTAYERLEARVRSAAAQNAQAVHPGDLVEEIQRGSNMVAGAQKALNELYARCDAAERCVSAASVGLTIWKDRCETLEARVRELEADRERLEWLERNGHMGLGEHPVDVQPSSVVYSVCWLDMISPEERRAKWTTERGWWLPTLRAAVDAARAKEPR